MANSDYTVRGYENGDFTEMLEDIRDFRSDLSVSDLLNSSIWWNDIEDTTDLYEALEQSFSRD